MCLTDFIELAKFTVITIMGVGSGEQRQREWPCPIWIFKHGTNIVDRGLKVLFSAFFLLFFGLFSVAPPPGKFSADALAYYFNYFNCATPTPPLVVNSTAAIYNSSGNFICDNGGVLLNSDGVEETETQTTCLVTARWSRQDELRCSNGNATYP